jgi:DHA1 family bicyclomycin/chloramphenicol resistance-like MFS transporter
MTRKNKKSPLEFVVLMASLMSIVALSMDALLPALGIMKSELAIENEHQVHLLITMMFFGLGFGQLLAGPLSDSFGRKPIIYAGSIIFLLASLIIVISSNFQVVIVGRILQGFGLSAQRTLSMAIVRDSYKGDRMAKVMSFISVTFILVPAIAPSFGKLILEVLSKKKWVTLLISQFTKIRV